MRNLLALRWSLLLLSSALGAATVSDPELNQLDLELRTYSPADNWITPYASNGPFCCPIAQLVISGENLVAVTSSGYWMSPNAENWNIVNRLPPDMLASTGESIFVSLPGMGFMEAVAGGQFVPVRGPQGGPVTDLTELDDTLFAADGSSYIFSASEQTKAWKRLPAVGSQVAVRWVAAAAGNLYAGVEKDSEIYVSEDRGATWKSAGKLPSNAGRFERIVGSNEEIYAVAEHGLFQRNKTGSWELKLDAPQDTALYSIVDFKGRRFAGTDRGLYELKDGNWVLKHSILSRGVVVHVSRGGEITFASTKNGLFESQDSGRTWKASAAPLDRGTVINGEVTAAPGRDFAATDKGLFFRSTRGSAWDALSLDNMVSPVSAIAITGSGKVVVVGNPVPRDTFSHAIYEGGESGSVVFHRLPALPYPTQNLRIAVVGEQIFALPDRGAFRLSADESNWIVEDSLAARMVFNIVKRGNEGFAAMTPENIFLRGTSPGPWSPLHVQIANATGAWFDPQHPEMVIAISGSGLSWNSDIFEPTRPVDHWTSERPLAFGAILSICPLGTTVDQSASFLVGTDYGVYLLVDKVHRRGIVERAWRRVTETWDRYSQEPWFWIVGVLVSAITAYVTAVLAVLFLAWKGVGGWIGSDWLLSLVTKPMEVSPRLLRWVLFFGYRKRLLKLLEIEAASERYFGLPATFSGGAAIAPDAEGSALHTAIAKGLGTNNCLLLQGEGGAGKSTVLARLTWLGLKGRLPGALSKCLPVYVPSSNYESDLIQAVSDTLRRRDGVPVDRRGDIARQQLEAGYLLVLFDGVSEIEGDKSKALVRMLNVAAESEMQKSWFVFSSRPLKKLPDRLPMARLEPLNIGVIQKVYLPTRTDLDVERRDQVLRQLNSFGAGPIEPLLLTLAINDSLDNTIVPTKAGLFERYFRRILRVQDDADQLTWDGWRTILATFADWFMLDTGRRGYGLTHRVLLRLMVGSGTSRGLLHRIESEYGLKFDNEIMVLEQLSSVGILAPGTYWRFRHDSFEAYFAAVRILWGLEEDHAVDLQIWTGPLAKDFLPVIEFVRELNSDTLIEKLVTETAGMPDTWRRVLTRA